MAALKFKNMEEDRLCTPKKLIEGQKEDQLTAFSHNLLLKRNNS